MNDVGECDLCRTRRWLRKRVEKLDFADRRSFSGLRVDASGSARRLIES